MPLLIGALLFLKLLAQAVLLLLDLPLPLSVRACLSVGPRLRLLSTRQSVCGCLGLRPSPSVRLSLLLVCFGLTLRLLLLGFQIRETERLDRVADKADSDSPAAPA